ncbi:DUF3617 domain-containing protein [Allosphingosinicella sp.]|uniref:DUF3617 domain-containing protein n=1 Tax=Allosphingosinicella sp. TaxID=2823234 RepID=UPI002FC18FF6
MRRLALIPLLVTAACSNATGSEQEAPKVEIATALQPGQWEITREITRLVATDNGEQAIERSVGSSTTFSHCLAAADAEKPDATLFAGIEGETCEYKNFYMSRGRINASLACTSPDLGGQVMRTIDGKFTADSIEAGASADTYFGSYGDVSISARMTGRRIGECVNA